MGFGDELMVTGHVRRMQLHDPRKVRIDYGVRARWSEIFDHNPRIAGHGEKGDFQVYRPRPNGMRPYIAAKTNHKWTWQPYKPEVGELYFSEAEQRYGKQNPGHIIVEPHNKPGASPNKMWGWQNWQQLVDLLTRAGYQVAQLGGNKSLRGVKPITSPRFRWGAAVLANSVAAVLPEGGLHHAAAAVGLRSVVLYGGYISPAQTGYDLHDNVFTGGEPCGMRVPCKHCVEAMLRIKPKDVAERVIALARSKA